MRIQQLLYLEQIVKKGSINEAAKELYLTQPSLSNAIKELEEVDTASVYATTIGLIRLIPASRDRIIADLSASVW